MQAKTIMPLMAWGLASVLCLSACNQQKQAEHKLTEDIAAEQAKLASDNNPAPAAAEPASQSFASATANTATAAASSSASSNTASATTDGNINSASAVSDTTAANLTNTHADDQAGEKLYASVCKTCHEGGLMGAPKISDKADWQARLSQGKDTLYQHSISGYQGKKGMMPARGGSNATDDEVKAAVDFMLTKSGAV